MSFYKHLYFDAQGQIRSDKKLAKEILKYIKKYGRCPRNGQVLRNIKQIKFYIKKRIDLKSEDSEEAIITKLHWDYIAEYDFRREVFSQTLKPATYTIFYN
jgi:hypothetical protein